MLQKGQPQSPGPTAGPGGKTAKPNGSTSSRPGGKDPAGLLLITLTLLFALLPGSPATSQDNNTLVPVDGRYAIDTGLKLVVWSPEAVARDLLGAQQNGQIDLNGRTYTLSDDARLLYNGPDTLGLVITASPLIHIQTTSPIVDEPKTPVRISYADKDTLMDLNAGIELRGNSALRYPKKSYDLEFREPGGTEKSLDVHLEGMRDDDDWILNSIYNEPLRLRSLFSNRLWEAIRDHREHTGRVGIRLRYAEVFLDDSYLGLYLISEQVDRKLLKLKKIKDGKVRGELFKAGSYEPGTRFTDAPAFNNALPFWSGFDMKYPYEDYTAHYDNLHAFVNLVSKAGEQEFNSTIADRLDMDNAIDYFLFVNLLRATDNLGKNYFLARRDDGEPYFFVPWDLDGVLGIIQDGKRIATTNDILSNGLFDRLWENDPSGYRRQVKDRWKELRAATLSNEQLLGTIERLYTTLREQGAYQREQLVWAQDNDPGDDYQYLTNWLKERLVFLDGYFLGE